MGTVRTSSKLVTRSLVESWSGTVGQVDRDKRVIHGVKILGKTSPNTHGLENIVGTEYTNDALDKAISLYEGRKSFADHPPRSTPGVERATRDLVGVHRNVRREADGLYSDFHYRSAHAYLADDAEQMPDALGFSHNATGSGKIAGGKYIVESIDKVRSIDLVTQPATTRGLYESEETMSTKTVAEALKPLKLGTKIEKLLFEDYGMASDAALAAPAGDDAPDYKDHLGEAIKAVLSDDSLDIAGKKAKILAILKATDDAPKADTSSDSGGSATDTISKAEKTSMESLQEKLKELTDELALRDLCEAENFKPSKVQRKALALLESEDDRLEFIAEAKAAAKPVEKAEKLTGPRSQSSRTLQESAKTSGDKPADNKGWLTRLKSPVMN